MAINFKLGSEARPISASASAAQLQVRFREGLALHKKGQLVQAHQIYLQVLKFQPRHFDALHMLGVLAGESDDPLQSVQLISRAIEVNPSVASAFSNRGNALSALNHYQDAIADYDRALLINPDHANAHANRGKALSELKQFHAAITSYDKAIAINPGNAETYFNRGVASNELKQYGAAVDSYDRAIAVCPNFAAAYCNRGVALNNLKQHQAAVESHKKAVAIQPDFAEAYYNGGIALSDDGQRQAAIASYDRAIDIRPDFAQAYLHRGNLLSDLGEYQLAISSFDSALAIKPDYGFVFGIRLQLKKRICDWSSEKNEILKMCQEIQDNEKVATPFSFLALSSSLLLQRKAAEIWIKANYPEDKELGIIPKRTRKEKIRLGYFSMDFRNHPVSLLAAGLFEAHNRDKFEVFAFSYGPNIRDEMRTRLEGAFDKFIDVRDKSSKEIAHLARLMEIDIAIDLAGLTGEARTDIFALRAAPLQVNYLGYAGTMAARYIDYLIADKQVIPEKNKAQYAEKIVYLPSFQANDRKRTISDRVFTRDELGLPQAGFVYCCLVNSYKIAPDTFDGWMRIMKRVEGSVLFLRADSQLLETNLRAEAACRGVDASRLVFGKGLPTPEYLARYRCVDLFLDTFPFNAGTTASDALWVGLPVVTCVGEAFASRMAASLLNAVNLPELITASQGEYEALAVELATNPERINAIRQKLERNRMTTPLFDTELFARHIEKAYAKMMDCYHTNLLPDHIDVGH